MFFVTSEKIVKHTISQKTVEVNDLTSTRKQLMSKLLLPLLVLCLVGWLFGGSAWFGSHFSIPSEANTWLVQDGNQSFSAPNKIAFSLHSREVLTNDSQLKMLTELAEYLASNPNRHLRMTGLYTKDEVNNSESPNLGIARAETVRNLIYRNGLVDLERLEIGHRRVKELELNPYGFINEGVVFEFFESPVAKYGEAFKLHKELFFKRPSDINFIKEKDFDTYLQSIRQYLVDHPQQSIFVKGFHQSLTKDEITQKRVENIFDILKSNGIKANRITTTFDNLSEVALEKQVDGYLELRIY